MLELLEKSDVKKEIDLAKQIQLSLLPQSDLKVDGLETYSFANTAQVVGGDYIDFIENENGLYVVIADVAGKGLTAALYMVRVQALVKMIIEKQSPSPKQLFLELNEYIKSNSKDKTFVTAVAVFFPKEASHFLYARAGHNHPLFFQDSTEKVAELDANGFALGMTNTKKLMGYLNEVQVPFLEGDSLVLYTDGLNEARNNQDEEFGMANLKTILELYGRYDANAIVKKIQSSLGNFIGNAPIQDDITFTCIKRTKHQKLPSADHEVEHIVDND
jgi:serine phosphatase RsbU (regulator of sigma subunit)